MISKWSLIDLFTTCDRFLSRRKNISSGPLMT
jgi:hypothetical protein